MLRGGRTGALTDDESRRLCATESPSCLLSPPLSPLVAQLVVPTPDSTPPSSPSSLIHSLARLRPSYFLGKFFL